MSLRLTPIENTNVVELELSDKLAKSDYADLGSQFEALVEAHGRLRLLLVMHEFSGIRLNALWQELKFCAHHHQDFERIACVGDKRWEKRMVEAMKPLTNATVRYFDIPDVPKAQAWLLGKFDSEADEEARP
jgi:hypothetical protein